MDTSIDLHIFYGYSYATIVEMNICDKLCGPPYLKHLLSGPLKFTNPWSIRYSLLAFAQHLEEVSAWIDILMGL